LGVELDSAAEVRRGDLLFWHGHVAFVVDHDMLLHANAGHMMTVYEPLETAVDRIAAQGDGGITLRRRLTKPENGPNNKTITTEKTDD
jgi:cell wall-associated NlpC family hydrolase